MRLTKSPGFSKDRFEGARQEGWGPDYWGISREQILAIKTHPGYTQITMKEFVTLAIKPITDGTRLGYALLINKEHPLKVKVMVSVSISTSILQFL